MPDPVLDEYQADPYKPISKAKYLNMMICHAISTDDELKFMKLMQKLQGIDADDEEDVVLMENLNVLLGKTYAEVRQLCLTKSSR